jgi:hypothetical protein
MHNIVKWMTSLMVYVVGEELNTKGSITDEGE